MAILLEKQDFSDIYDLLEASFPHSEFREREAQAALFDKAPYRVYGLREGEKLLALCALWELPGWRYLEHLAVASELRGRGIGAALLREIRELPGKLILEIEKPDDAKTQRRLRFYEREGLTLAPFGYDAPGYQAGTGDCPLQLMSEGAMSKLEFARHCAFLQEVVLDCTAGGAKPLCIWKE